MSAMALLCQTAFTTSCAPHHNAHKLLARMPVLTAPPQSILADANAVCKLPCGSVSTDEDFSLQGYCCYVMQQRFVVV